jgi:hypothetical protein
MALNRIFVEPMTGIEPAYSAWEAISSAERLCKSIRSGRRQRTQMPTAPAFFGSFGTRSRFRCRCGCGSVAFWYARGAPTSVRISLTSKVFAKVAKAFPCGIARHTGCQLVQGLRQTCLLRPKPVFQVRAKLVLALTDIGVFGEPVVAKPQDQGTKADSRGYGGDDDSPHGAESTERVSRSHGPFSRT